jgi:hypothetical protein
MTSTPAQDFRRSGLSNFHGVLIKAKINTSTARGLWHELAGDADVQPYDPNRRAIPYCLKQAFRHCGNYDLGGNKKAFRPLTL